MKYIAIVLGTMFLLASCTQTPEQNTEETPSQATNTPEETPQEETLDEATLKALNDPVKPDPDKPIGVTFGEPENVVEVTKPEVSPETRTLINEHLVGKWVTPGNESKNLEINDDDTFVFNITKEDIPLTGAFIVKDMDKLLLPYATTYIELNIVQDDEGNYRLMNTEEGENFVKK